MDVTAASTPPNNFPGLQRTVAADVDETLWTDDSGAYYVRINSDGVISWTDMSGAASAAPGVGARPAAGSSGDQTDLATEATALDILTALETVPGYLPPEPVVPSTDTTLTPGTINLSAAIGDQTLVTATASQSTRVHRLFATFTGGASESLVTVKSGATAIGYFRVPTAGLVVDLEFSSYWHYKTANNEAFILSPSVALNIAGSFQYVKGT